MCTFYDRFQFCLLFGCGSGRRRRRAAFNALLSKPMLNIKIQTEKMKRPTNASERRSAREGKKKCFTAECLVRYAFVSFKRVCKSALLAHNLITHLIYYTQLWLGYAERRNANVSTAQTFFSFCFGPTGCVSVCMTNDVAAARKSDGENLLL